MSLIKILIKNDLHSIKHCGHIIPFCNVFSFQIPQSRRMLACCFIDLRLKTEEKIKDTWNFSILNLKIHLDSVGVYTVSRRKSNFNLFLKKKVVKSLVFIIVFCQFSAQTISPRYFYHIRKQWSNCDFAVLNNVRTSSYVTFAEVRDLKRVSICLCPMPFVGSKSLFTRKSDYYIGSVCLIGAFSGTCYV